MYTCTVYLQADEGLSRKHHTGIKNDGKNITLPSIGGIQKRKPNKISKWIRFGTRSFIFGGYFQIIKFHRCHSTVFHLYFAPQIFSLSLSAFPFFLFIIKLFLRTIHFHQHIPIPRSVLLCFFRHSPENSTSQIFNLLFFCSYFIRLLQFIVCLSDCLHTHDSSVVCLYNNKM